MTLLDRDLGDASTRRADRERGPLWRTRLARGAAGVLLLVAVAATAFAWIARRDRANAQLDLAVAREALDGSLRAADRDPARAAADVPQFQALRREVLANAERFYAALLIQPGNQSNLAFAHLHLGQIHRMREQPDEAIREYQEAMSVLQDLNRAHPENDRYRAALASAHGGLGETFRTMPGKGADAEQAYGSAFEIQQRLVAERPQDDRYREGLAATHYRRGMLRALRPDGSREASDDFGEAARLLEPLSPANDRLAQELARIYGSLAGVLERDPDRSAEARAMWEKAIAIDERLVIKDSTNRDARLELASFCNSLASLLNGRGETDEADRRSRMALGLLDSLARVPPSMALARADTHRMRGLILQGDDPQDALDEFEEALDLFDPLLNDRDLQKRPDFHTRYLELVRNLAAFPGGTRDAAHARQLLSRSVDLYAKTAAAIVASGSTAAGQSAAKGLAHMIPLLPEAEQMMLNEPFQRLQRRFGDGEVQ